MGWLHVHPFLQATACNPAQGTLLPTNPTPPPLSSSSSSSSSSSGLHRKCKYGPLHPPPRPYPAIISISPFHSVNISSLPTTYRANAGVVLSVTGAAAAQAAFALLQVARASQPPLPQLACNLPTITPAQPARAPLCRHNPPTSLTMRAPCTGGFDHSAPVGNTGARNQSPARPSKCPAHSVASTLCSATCAALHLAEHAASCSPSLNPPAPASRPSLTCDALHLAEHTVRGVLAGQHKRHGANALRVQAQVLHANGEHWAWP